MRFPLLLLTLLSSCQAIEQAAPELLLEVVPSGPNKFTCTLTNNTDLLWLVDGYGPNQPRISSQDWTGSDWSELGSTGCGTGLTWSVLQTDESWTFFTYSSASSVRVSVYAIRFDSDMSDREMITVSAAPSNTVMQTDRATPDR